MIETSRHDALNQITLLAAAHDIGAEEIAAAIRSKDNTEKPGGVLGRILAYVGGALLFGGLVLFIGMQWGAMGSMARVIITYGSGTLAFVLGFLCLADKRYQNAATPLFLAAAALQPAGMFVFLNEYTTGNDAQLAALCVFSLMAIEFFAVFWASRRTALLFFGFFFYQAVLSIFLERVDMPYEWIVVVVGAGIVAVSTRIDNSPHCAIVPFWYFVGGMVLLLGAFDLVNQTPFDLLFLILSVSMMYFSVRMRSRALLIVNTLGLLGFLSYYTAEYFADTLSWPIALILMGFMLIGVSAGAIHLNKKIKAL